MWSTIPRTEERSSRPRIPRQAKTPQASSGIGRHGSLTYGGVSSNECSDLGPLSPPQSGYGYDNYDDGSSCDDTYVSMASPCDKRSMGSSRDTKSTGSSRGRVFQDNASSTESQIYESGILQETSRVSNRPRSISSSPFKSSSNKAEHDGYGENSSTFGILDKLKDDINSLELWRTPTAEVSEDDRSNARRSKRIEAQYGHNRSKSSTRSSHEPWSRNDPDNSDFPSTRNHKPKGARSRSVDPRLKRVNQVFHDSDPGLAGGTPHTSHGGSSDAAGQRSQTTENLANERSTGRNPQLFERDFCNRRSKSSVRGGSSDFSSSRDPRTKSIDHFLRNADPGGSTESGSSWRNKNRTNLNVQTENDEVLKKLRALEQENARLQETVRAVQEDSDRIAQDSEKKLSAFSHNKAQLENSKLKEAELERALREVLSNVESEQGRMSDELSTSHVANDQLLKKFKVLEKENKLLQETVSSVRDDSHKIVEQHEKELNECSITAKLQLEKSKTKETEFEQALRQVLSSVEGEQESMSEELSIAHKLRHVEVTVLKEKLKGASEEVAEKTSIIHKLEANMGRLKTENSSLKESNMRLEHSSADFTGEYSKASDELGDLKAKNDSLEENVVETMEENSKLKEALANAEEEHLKTTQKFSNWEAEIADLRNEVVEKDQIMAGMELELENVSTERMSDLEAENDSLQKKIAEKNEAIGRLEKCLAESKAALVDMELDLENLKTSFDSNTRNSEIEKKEHIDGLEKKIAKIDEEKQAQSVQIEKLMTDLSKSESKQSAMNQEDAETKTNLNEAKKEIKALNEEVQGRDTKLMKMHKETELLTKQVHDLKANIGEYEMKKNKLEQNVLSLQSELVIVNEHLQQSKNNNAKLQKVAEEQALCVQDNESNLNEEISSLQSELSSVSERLQTFKSLNNKLQKEVERLSTAALDNQSERNGTIRALESELANVKMDLEQSESKLSKVRRESASRNGQLKSALQSLDEMMKYIETMQKDSDEAEKSLESDLERAIKMKHDVEKEMKRTIGTLQRNEKQQHKELRHKDEEKKKLVKDLEASRIAAIKEVSKVNDSCAKTIAEMKKMHEIENGRRLFELKKMQEQRADGQKARQELEESLQKCSSQVDSLTLELQQLRDQKNGDEKIKQELSATVKDHSFQVESLTLELKKLKEKSDADLLELKTSLHERSSQVESLMDESKKLREQSSNDWKTQQDLEASRQECSSQLELLTLEVQKLREQSNHDGKIKEELEALSKERSSQVDELEIKLTNLQRQSDNDGKVKQELKSSMQEKVAQLNKQIEDLELAVKEKSSESVSLHETVEKLETHLSSLKQNCNEEASMWSKKLDECKDEISQVSDKLEFSVSRHSSLAKEKGQLNEKLRLAEIENKELSESLKKLEESNNISSSEHSDLTKMLEKKMTSEKRLRKELAQKKQMVSILQSNENHLEQHIASLEEQINTLVSEYESKLQADRVSAGE